MTGLFSGLVTRPYGEPLLRSGVARVWRFIQSLRSGHIGARVAKENLLFRFLPGAGGGAALSVGFRPEFVRVRSTTGRVPHTVIAADFRDELQPSSSFRDALGILRSGEKLTAKGLAFGC